MSFDIRQSLDKLRNAANLKSRRFPFLLSRQKILLQLSLSVLFPLFAFLLKKKKKEKENG